LVIIEKYTSTFPVQLGELAKELGVSAVKISSFRTGISGQIAKEGGQYVIRVNRNEARERQRFTIAHELAHFLLHRPLIDDSPDGITDNVLYRSGAPQEVEYEANRLAADLIMPVVQLKMMVESYFNGILNDAAIEKLASDFGVSKAAMEIQLSKVIGV